MTQYLLLPGADTAKLGTAHYVFDRSAIETNVVSIPTQRVSSGAARAIATLKREKVHRSPRTRAEIEAFFRKPAELAFIDQLVRAGYLDPVEPITRASRRARPRDAQRFRERGLLHFFKQQTFFNLPDAIDDDAVDVGLFGVPFSSTGESTGSIHAPGFLRSLTGRRAFWFDVHRDGFHTDVGSAGKPRGVLGKGVVAKDYGDIGPAVRRVGELFSAIDEVVADIVVGRGVRPLFVGGDHAVTFPIVHALLRHLPDLCVLHLDAHHDLFYATGIHYHHATPMRSLLLHSGLKRLCSMGLRTTFDPRVAARSAFDDSRVLAEGVRSYSLPALRRLLQDPRLLKRELDAFIGRRPCYLSVDVDVLSATALSGRTSTPAGLGLDWPELLETLLHLFASRNIVAADVVELDPFAARAPGGDELLHLPALVALLLHGLAQSRMPARRRLGGGASGVPSGGKML